MNPQDQDLPDPLLDVLSDISKPLADHALREAVFKQTASILRHRVLFRKAAFAASLFGCYLAGVSTMWVWSGTGRAPIIADAHSVSASDPESSDQGVPQTESETEASAVGTGGADPRSPLRDQSPFAILCAQGDAELFEHRDISSATKLYLRALREASQEELAVSAENDNWLLMSIKLTHTKEVEHGEI